MSQINDHERPFFIPKDLLDTGNSISWFFLDACWMIGFHELAFLMVAPTVLSGLLLLYIEKRRHVFFINLAIMSWISMNSLWMFSDVLQLPALHFAAKVALVLGLFFIGIAAFFSKDLHETFSHFKRFRVFKF